MTTLPKPTLHLVDEPLPRAASESAMRTTLRMWGGLIWGEWYAHSRLVLAVALIWLAAVWFLPLVAHPAWILALGGLFGVVGGPVFGGSDVMGGCEEYSFSQPATRRQRFDARLAVAIGCVLSITAMNVLALQNNLTDLVLSFFVSTGIAIVELRRPELLYGVVLVLPLTALAVGFSVASLASSRAVAYTAWVWGALGALTGLRAGLSLEDYVWERLNGRITIPLLVAISMITLGMTRRLYAEKEAGRTSSPLRLPLSGWAALGAAALAGLVVALLLVWFITNFARGL